MPKPEIEGNGTSASVHLVLQGKGGVGKSFVSAILAQYFRTKPVPVNCLDTDPVNATFAQYRVLEAEYGQDGVQVAWSRIIYPDASSVDLDGMMGLDFHGNAGLRDKVDRHYLRIVGFSVLTSIFTAAFEISQRSSQSALTYPTPTQTAGSAVGQELSQTGAQITRRNLNLQPTIKVPAGYKFTVRVNRDILFEAPYRPVSTGLVPRGDFQNKLIQPGA